MPRNKRADLTNPTSPFYCGDGVCNDINDGHCDPSSVIPQSWTDWADAPEDEKPDFIKNAEEEETGY